jgi:uncharacterized membrane protein
MNPIEERTPSPRLRHLHRYYCEGGVALALYIAAVVARHYALEQGHWPLAFSLLPAVPVALGIAAILRYLRRLDELERTIQLYAFAFAALATAFVSVVCGLLEDVVIGRVNIWIVWPLIFGIWGITSASLSWYYRRGSAGVA